jgi:C4-type Zn-finger protein
MTVTVSSTSDLWRVCLKSKWARIEIPELEFEISADGKRHTDSIYNHIASAVYNLGNYVSCTDRIQEGEGREGKGGGATSRGLWGLKQCLDRVQEGKRRGVGSQKGALGLEAVSPQTSLCQVG